MEFIEWFKGQFDNWQQAASDPTKFAHIIVEHTQVDDFEFHISQRYSYQDKPYRKQNAFISILPDRIILKNDFCDVTFVKQDEIYVGESDPGAKVKGANFKSLVTLSESTYTVIDQAHDDQGVKLWGSDHGPFIFKKV